MFSTIVRYIMNVLCVIVLFSSFAFSETTKVYVFSGGPLGGTSQIFADALMSIVTNLDRNIFVTAESSEGSVNNLALMQQHKSDFGIINMADAYIARQGALSQLKTSYQGAQAVGFLYNSPAQLIVHKNSSIDTVYDLAGKRIAVGNPGSGGTESCERFLRHLGLWDKVIRKEMGYAQAADAFLHNKIDAFWVMAGAPITSVVNVALRDRIRLLDLGTVARKSGFYTKNPFYIPLSLPGGAYKGQILPVSTFGSATYLMTRDDTPSSIVKTITADLYNPKGIQKLEVAHEAALQTLVEDALLHCIIPVHPGAIAYYRSIGLPIRVKNIP